MAISTVTLNIRVNASSLYCEMAKLHAQRASDHFAEAKKIAIRAKENMRAAA